MGARAEKREVYERRVWRLAFLLTGNAAGAARLVHVVLRDQPNLQQLEPARLDRVVVLHAREIPPAAGPSDALVATTGEAAEALAAVLKLPEQQREAWVLARVDELDELHVSRAMDCSKTASANHLAAADERMAARFEGDAKRPAAALRRFADTLDPGGIIQAHRRRWRQSRVKKAAIITGVLLVGAMIAGLAILQGWFA